MSTIRDSAIDRLIDALEPYPDLVVLDLAIQLERQARSLVPSSRRRSQPAAAQSYPYRSTTDQRPVITAHAPPA